MNCQQTKSRFPPPPYERHKREPQKLCGRLNYGLAHHFEASVGFFASREDFPAIGSGEMLYVDNEAGKIYSFDEETLKYKIVGIGKLDPDTITDLIGEEYVKADDLQEITAAEVDEIVNEFMKEKEGK